jgi:protease II
LVYEETDPRFFVGVMKSASKRFIFVTSAGNNMSEWRFVDANVPDSGLTLVQPRREDFEYDVDHHGERFLIRNNVAGGMEFVPFSQEIKDAHLQTSIDVVIPNWVYRNGGPESEAVTMFNEYVGPIVGVKINADGSASRN